MYVIAKHTTLRELQIIPHILMHSALRKLLAIIYIQMHNALRELPIIPYIETHSALGELQTIHYIEMLRQLQTIHLICTLKCTCNGNITRMAHSVLNRLCRQIGMSLQWSILSPIVGFARL